MGGGEPRLVGGGFTTGKVFNEVRTSVFTGNIEDAAGIIDGDIITPRHHCNQRSRVKLFEGIKVNFDQQGTSEAVTVQWRLNDASTWNSFADSPYTVPGTAGEVRQKYFPLMKAGTHLQLRFRCNNSGQVFRIQGYILVFKILTDGVVVPTT